MYVEGMKGRVKARHWASVREKDRNGVRVRAGD